MDQFLANGKGRGAHSEVSEGLTSQTESKERNFEREFGIFLVDTKIIDAATLERACGAARKAEERIDRVLTKLGLISERDLIAALSKFSSLPVVSPSDIPVERIIPDVVEADFVRRSKVMPLAIDDAALTVGAVDILNEEPLAALSYLAGLPIRLQIFVPADFEAAFSALYTSGQGDRNDRSFEDSDAREVDVQRLRDMASEAPIIRLVNQIIAAAVEAHASDIHIEPGIDQVLVRYRIDGMLRNAQMLSAGLRAAITSRVKIMAKLDIAERRMPQDGRIKIAVRGNDVDFRVSTLPTMFGESVVMRILDRGRVALDFQKLGFSDNHIATLHRLLQEPNGIVLVTGPTGSGKTTTLYTALRALNSTERKIFSVEDPIEYQLLGINQLQVQSEIGLTFPHALRAILRQDPDIIMIGEIRDLETARIAIQASLTGHLVLSTLHTNSAAAAITRLTNVGVENYLLASTVKGVVAQRLVRLLCQKCSCPHDAASYWTLELTRTAPGLEELGPPMIRKAVGCHECGNTGFSGRSTIAEILLVDGAVSQLVLARESESRIGSAAREQGMVTMFEMGAAKVWRGETTIEEVMRATRSG